MEISAITFIGKDLDLSRFDAMKQLSPPRIMFKTPIVIFTPRALNEPGRGAYNEGILSHSTFDGTEEEFRSELENYLIETAGVLEKAYCEAMHGKDPQLEAGLHHHQIAREINPPPGSNVHYQPYFEILETSEPPLINSRYLTKGADLIEKTRLARINQATLSAHARSVNDLARLAGDYLKAQEQ